MHLTILTSSLSMNNWMVVSDWTIVVENGESRDHLGRESAGDCNGEWNGSGPSHNRLPVSSQNHWQQSGDSLIVSYFNYYVRLVSDKAQDAREQGNICRQVAHLVVLLKCSIIGKRNRSTEEGNLPRIYLLNMN